jgi:trans-2,3-dihydro-3-hydroxyanthranilate isomerase
MDLVYYLVDVFTSTPYSGNQLAVVFHPPALPASSMANIAKEFGYSETAFISDEPTGPRHLRIWTPFEEIPVAGHPLVGAVHALRDRGEGDGTITFCLTDPHDGSSMKLDMQVDDDGIVWMPQPEVSFVRTHPDPGRLAESLGLAAEDLAASIAVQSVAVGHPFTLVALTSVESLSRVVVDRATFRGSLDGLPEFVYCFSAGEAGVADAECRLFAPFDILSGEDAASGSAAGALAHLLRASGIPPRNARTYTFHQGVQMGRPSRIHARETSEGVVLVGGTSVTVAEGLLRNVPA